MSMTNQMNHLPDGFEIVNLADIHPSPPVATVVDNAIVFVGHEHYQVDLDRCDTPEKLIGWIAHMAEKQWFTTRMIREMVSIASNAHGFKIHGLY